MNKPYRSTRNAESLESRSSLADSCVSSGLVFCKFTERLSNCGDHPIHKKGNRIECTDQSTSQFSIPRKV